MAIASYAPVSNQPDSLTPSVEKQPEIQLSNPSTTSWGEPGSKRLFHYLDLAALAITVGCLVAAVCVISPQSQVAWRLGLSNQLIIIGFLLSIMNQCLRQIAPNLFLVLEARWGQSILQNYDAILRNSSLVSHTHLLWRTGLFLLIALPLALSAAYKRFIDGNISVTLPEVNYNYGMTGPPGLHQSGHSLTGISHMFNATSPFIVASHTIAFPQSDEYPIPFGFNNLLLSNQSVAFLDAPVAATVLQVQKQLTTTETWNMTADVFAVLVEIDATVDANRNNQSFWDEYGTPPLSTSLTYRSLYNGYEIGLLACQLVCHDNTWSFLSIYPAPTNINDTERQSAFQNYAYMFSHRRAFCTGTWIVTQDTVALTTGSCNTSDPGPDQQNILLNNTLSVSDWYLPFLAEYLNRFTPLEDENSPWKLPTFVTTIAGIFWSRVTGLNGAADGAQNFQDMRIYYSRQTEITSTRSALYAHPVLYLVLGIQPVLTVIFFIIAALHYHVPVDRDFGMITILAGAQKDSLKSLRGAALSGTLKVPVKVGIEVHDAGGESGEIRYVIGEERKQQKVVHGREYC